MILTVKIICSMALIQTITCQGIGNVLNAGFNNGPAFGTNFPNGMVGHGAGGLGLGGPGLIGAGSIGLGGSGLIGAGNLGLGGPGLIGSGFAAQGLVGNGIAGPGLGGPGLVGNGLIGSNSVGQGLGCGRTSGGGFAVTSTSPISPTGVSILAENLAIEGPLSVGGQLPFLGTVGVEGTLAASGSGTVSYGCGNGNVGITNDMGTYGTAGQYGLGPSQYGPGPSQYGPGPSQYGPGPSQYGPGLAGYGSIAGQGVGVGLTGYNPGLLGSGLVGNGLAGGLANLAGPGNVGVSHK